MLKLSLKRLFLFLQIGTWLLSAPASAVTIYCTYADTTCTAVNFSGCSGSTDCNTTCLDPAAYGYVASGAPSSSCDCSCSCTQAYVSSDLPFVTPIAAAGGTISPNTGQTVASGGNTVFTVTPNSGFVLYSVTGTCPGSLNGSTYTAGPINSSCTVVANFALATADFYRLEPSQQRLINVHGTCSKVTNNLSSPLFVPAKTSTEWSSFRTNASVTKDYCP